MENKNTALVKSNTALTRVSNQIATTNRLLEVADPFLIPYRKGDKWGFCDRDKRIVIECVYDEVKVFSDGLAAVNHDKAWGFVNVQGKLVIEMNFSHVYSFSEGLALVTKLDEFSYGFIDTRGLEKVPFIYSRGESFRQGLAKVVRLRRYKSVHGEYQDYRCGYVDKKGNEVVDCQYENIHPFINEVAIIENNDRYYEEITYGLIGKNGEKLTNGFKYENLGSFREGFAKVYRKGYNGFIDKNGIELGASFSFVNDFSEGFAYVSKYNEGISSLGGFINTKGEDSIPFKYENQNTEFSEGLAAVQLNGKWGFIDKKGNTVVDFIYDSAQKFREGYSFVELSEKCGFINKKGNVVIPFLYDKSDENIYPPGHSSFHNGLAIVSKENMYGIIDVDNNCKVEFNFIRIGFFSKSLIFLMKNKGYYCLTNNIDWQVNSNLYTFEIRYSSGNRFPVKRNEKTGFVNELGKEIIPCKYDKISSYYNWWNSSYEGLAFIWNINKSECYYFDKNGVEYFDVRVNPSLD